MKKRNIILIIISIVLVIIIGIALVVFLNYNNSTSNKDENISISLDELDKKIEQSNEFEFSKMNPIIDDEASAKFLIDKSTENPERKSNELNKLQAMVDYCHTPNCLRAYILNYFGDHSNISCQNCSNCQDNSEVSDVTIDAQKVFSCVYRLKERFGVNMIADVLKGSKNKKVLQFGFDQLPTYGLFKTKTVNEIKNFINILTATQYLSLAEGEFPIVKLTPEAYAVMKNEAKVLQKTAKVVPEIKVENSLFDELRALRKEIATNEKIPPYMVFSDATLQEMASKRPTDELALSKVKGVGEVKLKKYSTAFLKILNI